MMGWLKEVARYFLYLYRNLSGLWKKLENDFSRCAPDEKVVVLVQGYTLSYYAMGGVMKKRLESAGYRVFVFEPGSTLNIPIEDIAKHLGGLVTKVCRECNLNDVYLIGHSLGGVVARYYMQNLGGDKHVKKLIALGAAWFGTRIAILACYTKPARQMLPHSSFLKGLNSNTGLVERIVSIYTRHDQFVVPWSSAVLPGARNIEMNLTGHTILLESEETLAIIKRELS